mmetsp:Transcript_30447/g.56453  ORF Transcript_30447/g.56453 Transcript_30447/m.56453 type:complete len:204 (-) Transcript_30447:147-758(-)
MTLYRRFPIIVSVSVPDPQMTSFLVTLMACGPEFRVREVSDFCCMSDRREAMGAMSSLMPPFSSDMAEVEAPEQRLSGTPQLLLPLSVDTKELRKELLEKFLGAEEEEEGKALLLFCERSMKDCVRLFPLPVAASALVEPLLLLRKAEWNVFLRLALVAALFFVAASGAQNERRTFSAWSLIFSCRSAALLTGSGSIILALSS